MRTPAASILYFPAASLLGAVGRFLYKTGADRAAGSLASYLLSGWILGGVACYAAVMGLFVAAFRQGGEPTVLYPLYATTFIGAAVIAFWAYNTPIKPVNALGMGLVVAGMILMGK